MSDSITLHGSELFGVHFMVDGYNAPNDLLSDKDALEKLLKTLPSDLGMHAISEPTVLEVGPGNTKDPGGLSGFILIAESHISFHTFPKRGFITVDVYSCKNDIDVTLLLDRLKSAFQFTDEDTHIVQRGIRYPSQNIHS